MTRPVAFPLKLAAPTRRAAKPCPLASLRAYGHREQSAVSGSELIAQATRAVGLCPPRMVALPERMRTRS